MKTLTDNEITICGHGSGTPSKKNMSSYCETRYRQKAKNGVHKGVVEVRRYVTMTDEKRKEFCLTYKTILGRNRYSQELRAFVYTKCRDGKYYSDCSSSGMATYQKIGLDTGGLLNTAGIHSSGKFTTVPVTIKNGHIEDPWRLEIGDCILFAGSDPSRPKQIGHVEYVFDIPGAKYKLKKKAYIYERKDQTAKHLTILNGGSKVRVLEDCKDGWSLVTDNIYIGYMKNCNIDKVGKSSYPIGYNTKECNLHEKNSSSSKTILKLPVNTSIKIITMRKNWTYISAVISGVKVKGWIPTKYVSYK